MDVVARLVEIDALLRLKARYFRMVDTQNWQAWGELFTDDAVLKCDNAVSTFGEDPQTSIFVGRDAIVDVVRTHMQNAYSVHHGHMPEIDIQSETQAMGIWAMADIVVHPEQTLHGAGHYHEEYRKVNGEWRFSVVHLTRLRLHVTPC